MKPKKGKKSEDAIPNPLIVDESEFTGVVKKMLSASPAPLEEIKKERRKNPETDPRYLPVFDFTNIIRIEKPKKK